VRPPLIGYAVWIMLKNFGWLNSKYCKYGFV
jgi:hypothetical protein